MGKKSAKRVTNFLSTSAMTRPLFMLGAASVLLGAGPASALDSNALPQNPNVVGGKDAFSQSGNTLNVNQSTKRTVIDWRSFDIGSKAQVNFNQPGTSSIAVNRVNGSTNPTDIEGGLHANGQVWVLNPNGVFFGKGARVDAAGIVATTANIDDKAFMAGSNKLQMTGADHGFVENQGHISVGQAGLAAFVAPSVRNSGVINATVGKVALAAGTTYTLDLAGDHLVELGLGSVKAVVDNSGKIVNPGGTIALTAKAAGQVVNSVVNVSGVVSASSVSKSGGTITLGADNVTTTSTAQLSADAGTNGNGGSITSVANVQGNYAGSFSAKGGSASGNGGKVETSGTSVTIADGISVDTRAANGILGNWTVDPLDISIVTGGDDSDTTGADGSITVGSIEHALDTTSLTISTEQGSGGIGDISLQSSINASGSGDLTLIGRHLSATGGSTISLAGALTLDVNYVNGSATPSGNWISDALGMVGGVAHGTTINLGAGTYAAGTVVAKDNVTINGGDQATIGIGAGQTGVTIDANNVTLENINFAGPLTQPYTAVPWNTPSDPGNSWAIQVTHATNSNFNITGNDIHDVRTGILIANSGNPATGAASGAITSNTFDNTKGGVIDQYRDGSTVNISGNESGGTGNEWGVVYNTNLSPAIISATPSDARQAALLAVADANTGLAVLDRGYTNANRTSVTVDDNATGTPDNGFGNARQPLATIQGGVNAVVAGGTVNVLDGTYVVSAANGYANGYLGISKSLNLVGESEGGVVIDARNASSYGVRIIGGTDGVTLSNFTLWGVTAAGGYGVKAEDTTNLHINNVTSQGAYKAQFDLNGVRTGEVNNVVANGNGVLGGTGSTKGAALAITDSQDVTVENSDIIGGSYGGIGIYQSNKAGGYSYQAKNITIADTNTYDANGAAHYNPVYTEDESATNNFGTLNIEGFNTVAGLDANPLDTFKYFQTSQQNAIDYLDAIAAVKLGYVEGWNGSAGDNQFAVANATSGNAMAINPALTAAAAGANITVAAGTYNENLTINKTDITLLSEDGAATTTIVGQGNTALGTVVVQRSDFTLGSVGHGFTVVGIDNASPGIESAAVYFQGDNSGSNLRGNTITANGDEALLTESGHAVSALTVDSNIFNGQTFAGANPAGQGSGHQFDLANVPRQLVVISGGNGGGTTSGIVFTNNQITGTAGGLNSSGQEQGNNLVTIDAHGATITGNTFAGTTDLWSDALRARGTDTTITGNTFDGTHMGAGTNMLEINDTAMVGSFSSVVAHNIWNNGSAWVNHAIAGVNYVFRGIQNAITGANAGDTVNVGAGTYAETLNISKKIDIEGAGVGQTIIQPTKLLDSGVGHKYSSDAKVTVLVNGASDVTLNGLTINGNDLGNDAVVLWNNASGSITNSLIENAKVFDGSQTGQALAVDASAGNTVNLTVDGVTFQNFNKNAIDAVNGNSLTSGGGDINLTVENSSITGAGDTPTIAQNGIVTWERGGGTINATIDNVSFSDLSFSDPASATAAGVLQYNSSNGAVVVKNSTFTNVQEYVSSAGGSTNEIDATTGNTFDGVAENGATLDQLYNIEDKIVDGTDDGTSGLVRLVAGHVYATAQKNSIQNAVDVASSGDTVNVQAGTYSGAVNVNKALTLEGANAGVNAADGTNTAPATRSAETILSHNGLAAVSVNATDVTIDGFEFTGGNGRLIDWASASNIDGLTIENNIFNTPSGPQNGGVIQLAGTGTSQNVSIANNLFEGSAFATSGDVSATWVYVGGTAADGLNISGNDFTGGADNAVFQSAPTFGGLQISNNYFGHALIEGLNMGSLDNPTIQGNTFEGVQFAAMQIGTTNGGVIQNNTIDGTGSGYNSGGVLYADGIDVWGGEWGTGTSNGLVIQNNAIKNFVDTAPLGASDRFAGIYLRPDAGAVTIQNNTIDNNTIGLLANTTTTGSTVANNTFTNNATHVLDLQGVFDLTDLAANNTLDRDVWITGGNALFGRIQTGVDAASSGNTVNVGAGLYVEQVTIDKNLNLVGAGAGSTIVEAPSLLATSFANSDGTPQKAIITVDNNATANISNLTVNGAGQGDINGNNAFDGIAIHNANATIDSVDIEGVRHAPLNGAQDGVGLVAFNDDGTARTVTLQNSTVEDFQKTGVAFIGGNLTANVLNNTITGAGSTAVTAQNGIEFYGKPGTGDETVTGTISGNTVTGVSYAPALNFSSTGILLIGADGTTVQNNTVTGEGTGDYSNGIYVSGGTVTVASNTVTDFGWGLDIDDDGGPTNVTVSNNTITGNGVGMEVAYQEGDTSVVNAHSNDFSNNASSIELESADATLDATGNYWGTTDDTTILAGMSGADAGSVNFSSFLASGTDTDSAAGFQGDFSHLIVTALGGGTDRLGEAVSEVDAGGTLSVNAGTYVLPGTLVIDKSLSLVGVGEGTTTIDGSGMTSGNAMRVQADDVSLSGFTLETSVNGFNGISVLKSSGFDSNGFPLSGLGVKNFSIADVTINKHAAGFVGLTLTGVEGATIDHVTADGSGSGNGIQIVDSANVVLTNNKTSNSDFGLFISQTGDATTEQTTGISADTSNSFVAALAPVRILDASTAGPGMGAVDIKGFAFALGSSDPAATVDSLELHNGLQGTIDRAAALDATNSFIEGWTGSGLDNTFEVGTSTGGTALSINTAVGAANAGGTINVASGTYAEDVTDATQLAFNFGTATVNSFTLASGGAGSSLNGNLTATGAIALNGASTVTGNLKAGSIATTAPLTLIGNATASGAVNFGGTTGVTGNVQGATIATTGPLTLVGDATATGGVTFGGVTSVTGNVKGSSVTANNTLALNGSATASGAITANGTTLLSGKLTGGSIALNGATKLTGNTTLDTSAANGAIRTASVDGTAAGGQSLGVNAGTDTVSLGNLGATTRLGAVSDASKTTLTGSTYNANSFLFGGDVTLTSADTTLNTTQSASAAGDITFQGDLFGTTDGAQSLTLIAGPGTGAASANGDMLLQNAGTSAVYLGDVTVTGNNFTALTVDVGGNYNALLTGNQVFAADTLNVRGDASSIVGGDASGHIVAGGDVTIVADGDVSGTISGQNVNLTGDDVNSTVTATNAANIRGNTVEGSYTAQTVTLIASNNVDAAVNATDFVLAANHGSVDGTWTTINTDGSNVVSVNGQTTIGLANINPNQLVVEGFILPVGTTIGANGQLVLPQGVLLGLLSPGGGKPKMILVHTVQQLGELLASGYSVIVIDLSNRDKGKPIQLASN